MSPLRPPGRRNITGRLPVWLGLMFGNARECYYQNGFTYLLRLSFAKAGFVRFSRSLKVIKLDIADLPHREGPVIFEETRIEDIYDDGAFNIGFFDRRKTIFRLLKGLRLFVVKEGPRIVFALWVEKKNASFWWIDLPLELPPDTAYISGVYTAPEVRNTGIYGMVKDQLYPLLRDEGITRLVGTIEPKNALSLYIHRKFGWSEYQTITYERFWHIRRYTVKQHGTRRRRIFFAIFRPPRGIWKTFLTK